jgi:hypothetical protein
MSAPHRSALAFALALGVATFVARPAHAQQASLAPAPASATLEVTAPLPSAVGPTIDAASVGVHHVAAAKAPARRGGGLGQAEAMMIVGGAAVLVGLLIGGGAGGAIAVGGAIIGLVGLYQYLQ